MVTYWVTTVKLWDCQTGSKTETVRRLWSRKTLKGDCWTIEFQNAYRVTYVSTRRLRFLVDQSNGIKLVKTSFGLESGWPWPAHPWPHPYSWHIHYLYLGKSAQVETCDLKLEYSHWINQAIQAGAISPLSPRDMERTKQMMLRYVWEHVYRIPAGILSLVLVVSTRVRWHKDW